MTQTSAALPAPLRLPVPQDQVIFQGISTDFYPWTEVLAELDALPDRQLTAVFDAQQQHRWARFVWVRGQFCGGVAGGGSDVTLAATTRALPRAQVSLIQTEPLVAEVIWECRHTAPHLLDLPWPQAQSTLLREQFQGALVSGPHCSFWQGGRVMSGSLPPVGAVCYAVASGQLNREAFLQVWREVVAATHQAQPRFDEIWKQVSMRLSEEYPVLDPFASEVVVAQGRLQVEEDVPAQELRPALLEAYRACLQRLGVSPAQLPLANLRQSPGWASTGLEQL